MWANPIVIEEFCWGDLLAFAASQAFLLSKYLLCCSIPQTSSTLQRGHQIGFSFCFLQMYDLPAGTPKHLLLWHSWFLIPPWIVQKSLGPDFRLFLNLLISLHSRLMWPFFLHKSHFKSGLSFLTAATVGSVTWGFPFLLSTLGGLSLLVSFGNWVVFDIWLLLDWKSALLT